MGTVHHTPAPPTHLHPPAPERLLVEEILVAAVPNVIIIKHSVFYLHIGRKKTNKSLFFFLNKTQTKKKTPAGHPQSQRRENKMLVTEGKEGRGGSSEHH